MGWFTLVNAGRTEPDVRIEDWPHAVEQPVGPALAAHFGAIDASRWADDRLLDHAWQLAEDVIQETLGAPGAEDPTHIVMRQQRGLRRAVEVDTALGGVLGACDGDLTLREILGAVAQLLDASDPSSLTPGSRQVEESLSPRVQVLSPRGLVSVPEGVETGVWRFWSTVTTFPYLKECQWLAADL
jgi:hypothetical protein